MSDDDEVSLPTNLYRKDDWDSQIARKLKQTLQQNGISYEWLADQVTLRSDTPVTAKKLKGQISKGNFSARLLLQIIDSLSDKRLSLRDLYHMDRAKRERE